MVSALLYRAPLLLLRKVFSPIPNPIFLLMSERSTRPESEKSPRNQAPSRRNFIKGGGMILAGHAIAANQIAVAQSAHAFGSEEIKLGLVGCGRRGTAVAIDLLGSTGGGVRLVSMADAFGNNLQSSYRTIKSKHSDKVDPELGRHVGLGGFRHVMASDADVVILATPPGFRPMHFEAAVEAGKHVFLEKPVATDISGVHQVIKAGRKAEELGLAVAVGLQRRHDPRYQDCIGRLNEGLIGDPVFARAYWNGPSAASRQRQKKQSELEYQLRNWQNFTWLGGDLICEQHIHNLDVVNWVMGDHPIQAQGVGSRSADASEGQIFDQNMIEYTYASGATLLSQCRRLRGCWNRVGEEIHGTQGRADLSSGKVFDLHGNVIWKTDHEPSKGFGAGHQHANLIQSLRSGQLPAEALYAANSTMTAIIGAHGSTQRQADSLGRRVQRAGGRRF